MASTRISPVDIETSYLCLSNRFYLILTIDKRILKSPLTWYWRHIKGHQENQARSLDIWAILNLDFDTQEMQKWILYQKSGINHTRPHNIQDSSKTVNIKTNTNIIDIIPINSIQEINKGRKSSLRTNPKFSQSNTNPSYNNTIESTAANGASVIPTEK